jgi:hypothetical protein
MRAKEFINEEITKVIQNFDPNDPDNYEGMSFQRTRADGVAREVPHGSSMHNHLYRQVTGKEPPTSPAVANMTNTMADMIKQQPSVRSTSINVPEPKYPQDTIKSPIKTIDDPDDPELGEAANAAQQAAIAINMKKHHKKPKHVDESAELAEEFDLIESIIERLAEHNGVDADVIWEDLETLTEDELYAFAVTSEPIMESEAWQKANNRDKTDGMSRKTVNTYRREHPGSKLQTAVTTKPSKLKKGSKASKRRKSYCSRSRGQMKMHNISCAKTPDKAICKARRRWNC